MDRATGAPALEEADLARYRAQLYAAASAAFTTEPTAEQLQSMVTAAAQDVAGEDEPAFACERTLLSHVGAYAAEDAEELRTRVATEYAELFVGPRPPLAPLYESVYIGAVKRLNTDVTMQVRRFYERCGFTAVKRNSVPNDHLGLELEFMARLCDREASALEAGDAEEARAQRNLQLQFLSLHLGAWIDPFAQRLSQAWCADYYLAWCRFVQQLVRDDDAFLSQALSIRPASA